LYILLHLFSFQDKALFSHYTESFLDRAIPPPFTLSTTILFLYRGMGGGGDVSIFSTHLLVPLVRYSKF
jgi:hypothetical protein